MWSAKKFEELSLREVEEIFRLRQSIFIIEQKSLFVDIDGQDINALHIFHKKNERVISYCRFIIGDSITIGRVIVNPIDRGNGKGRELFRYAVQYAQDYFPDLPINITAMCYLEKFYESFGFVIISERYDVAGHMHVDMVLK